MPCSKCNDTGWIPVNGGVTDCDCRKLRLHEWRLKKAGLPDRYISASLENYVTEGANPTVQNAALKARRYVEEYPTNPGQGILFTGSVGTGKTHLAIAILRELTVRYGVDARFADFRELLKKMQATFGPDKTTSERDILRTVTEPQIVVLDELGAARATDWTFDVVEHVINTRYNDAKRTILTTNLPNKPPGWTPQRNAGAGSYASAAAAAMSVETLGDRIGARMFSRLQEMCMVVEVNGEDYRSKGKR